MRGQMEGKGEEITRGGRGFRRERIQTTVECLGACILSACEWISIAI